MNFMGKAKWGKPAYKGSEDPLTAANYFMFIFVLILFLGFVQAGIKNGWFSAMLSAIFQ